MLFYFKAAKNYLFIIFSIIIFLFIFTVAPAAIIVGFVIIKTSHYKPLL